MWSRAAVSECCKRGQSPGCCAEFYQRAGMSELEVGSASVKTDIITKNTTSVTKEKQTTIKQFAEVLLASYINSTGKLGDLFSFYLNKIN